MSSPLVTANTAPLPFIHNLFIYFFCCLLGFFKNVNVNEYDYMSFPPSFLTQWVEYYLYCSVLCLKHDC